MPRRRMDEADEAVAEEATADVAEDEEETLPASAVVAVACPKCGGEAIAYSGESAHKLGSFECTPCNYRFRTE